MLRLLKYGTSGLLAVVLVAFFLFGSDLTGMIRTAMRTVQKSARENVPVEFELERAKEKINDILPDLQSQVRMIAEEEVAIARLEKELQVDQRQLAENELKLSSLRDQMRTTKEFYVVNGRDVQREQMTEQLQSRFNHFKQAELALNSKQRLLDKRKAGLSAALAMLDKMRTRQSELQLKVESLAAQHRLIKASQIESGTMIDGSQLSQADQLLSQLETRLAVAQKVLDYQSEQVSISCDDVTLVETDVLDAIDDYFGPVKTDATGKMADAR
jgi:chromosome segregation ATPase